ncbi:MAG TPA: hypothetical protein VH092_34680 [Urbifossiella sp.]|nr:hypothetical protein [Urbifossiella sp.]
MWPDCSTDFHGLDLLRAAHANPLDCASRFVIADWLQGQGEEDVAATLRASLGFRGWAEFPEVIQPRWAPWNGCVDGWLAVDGVLSGRLGEIPESPWLNAILFGDEPADKDLEALTRFPILMGLSMAASSLSDEGLARVARLNSLTFLDLAYSQSGIVDDKLKLLAPLTNLTTLRLMNTDAADDGLKHLAALPNLTDLDLYRTRVSNAGLKHLAVLPELTNLDLGCTTVSDVGLKELVPLKRLVTVP